MKKLTFVKPLEHDLVHSKHYINICTIKQRYIRHSRNPKIFDDREVIVNLPILEVTLGSLSLLGSKLKSYPTLQGNLHWLIEGA